ncbi:MAG TPA: hypothetical protein GXX51_12310 [Firmicutes bacterium]|nr:hypothetical protein [Bacillota bacterium]
MAQITWKSKAELEAEVAERQRQAQIAELERMLGERIQAKIRLEATGGTPEEVAEVQDEINAILEAIRNANTA